MAETKTINLDVETNLGSLRTQLRQAQAEVAAMAEKFGATSVEAANAAKKAAELRDRIQDAKNLTAAFNPEAKFAAIGQAVSAAAGGFTAFEGALGLAGVESENLQKQLLKVQSALALSQGVEQLGGLADALKNVKSIGVSTFNSIKTAIGSTGIGLFVIAAGTIYAYWEDITKSLKKSFPAFENIGTIFNKIKEVAFGVGNAITNFIISPFKAIGKLLQGDFSGALDEIKKGINIVGNYQKGALVERQSQEDDANKKRLEALIKQKDNEIEIEKARGRDTYKLELENYKRKKELAKENQEELDKIRQEERVLIASHNKQISDAAKKHQEELDKAAKEAAEKELERIIKQREEKQKLLNEIDDLPTESLNAPKEARDRDLESANSYYNELSKMSGDYLNKKASDITKEIQLENELRQKKLQMASNALSILSEATTLFNAKNEKDARAQFKIQKAFNLSAAIINTALAVTGALTAGGNPIKLATGMQFVEAGIAAAAGAVNIAKISATQFNSGGGALPSAPSPAGSTNVTSPNLSFSMQGAGGGIGQLLSGVLNQPIKAYVVSSDITNAQMLDAKAIKTSVL